VWDFGKFCVENNIRKGLHENDASVWYCVNSANAWYHDVWEWIGCVWIMKFDKVFFPVLIVWDFDNFGVGNYIRRGFVWEIIPCRMENKTYKCLCEK
jgi:hypothetical protein